MTARTISGVCVDVLSGSLVLLTEAYRAALRLLQRPNSFAQAPREESGIHMDLLSAVLKGVKFEWKIDEHQDLTVNAYNVRPAPRREMVHDTVSTSAVFIIKHGAVA